MIKLSQLSKKMIIIMLIIALIGAIFSVFLFFDYWINVLYGIFAGTLISILRFLSIEKSVEKSITLNSEKARFHSSLTATGRLFATLILITVLAFFHPYINLFGVGFGVLNMQISVYISKLFKK
ncbi:MAG: ATP synthase subunit I [Defluviitaleaceae bacterium]|nr:ATP synthase subunit I [Defluviitaleaceae bacterium]